MSSHEYDERPKSPAINVESNMNPSSESIAVLATSNSTPHEEEADAQGQMNGPGSGTEPQSNNHLPPETRVGTDLDVAHNEADDSPRDTEVTIKRDLESATHELDAGLSDYEDLSTSFAEPERSTGSAEAACDDVNQSTDIDSVIDFEMLAELDVDARTTSVTGNGRQSTSARNRQLGREMGLKARWREPEDLAVLEAIFSSRITVGPTATEIRKLMIKGITPIELEAANRFRELSSEYWVVIDRPSKNVWPEVPKRASRKVSWPRAWAIMKTLGVEADDEQLHWTLDLLQTAWLERPRAGDWMETEDKYVDFGGFLYIQLCDVFLQVKLHELD
jgi:hypothetical protein